MIQGNRIFLGRFATEEAAARAYDYAAVMAAGDLAMTNMRLGLFDGASA